MRRLGDTTDILLFDFNDGRHHCRLEVKLVYFGLDNSRMVRLEDAPTLAPV
jgi:hypothetical protein